MKKKKYNKNLFIIFVIVAAFIFGIYFSLNEKISFTMLSIKNIFYYPFSDLSNNKDDIVGKNINIELVEENDYLKDINNIKYSLSEFININATVIERNNSFWLDTITINKGKKDDIDVGMAVVVGEGLVGKIVNITNNTSIVRLITSDNSLNKISVKFKYNGKYINKVLETVNGKLVINGIDNNLNINIGSEIVTSGLSDIYPSGIIIGTVEKIEYNEYKTSKILYIKSNVDFNSLRFVTVLKRSS